MIEKENRMIKLVNDYEDGKISLDKTIEEFNKLSNRKIDSYILDNYWRSEDLENFVSRFAIDEIENWKEIDDSKAIKLIDEIKNNPGNIAVEERNIVALEKRYAKPEGSLQGFVHEEDSTKILDFLKTDNVIRL
ncbi:MAG: hypothetical protein MK202_02220 [Tenacibaculum sp.]|nr:hypothetical protein [Tenacibaculum sp.]